MLELQWLLFNNLPIILYIKYEITTLYIKRSKYINYIVRSVIYFLDPLLTPMWCCDVLSMFVLSK